MQMGLFRIKVLNNNEIGHIKRATFEETVLLISAKPSERASNDETETMYSVMNNPPTIIPNMTNVHDMSAATGDQKKHHVKIDEKKESAEMRNSQETKKEDVEPRSVPNKEITSLPNVAGMTETTKPQYP